MPRIELADPWGVVYAISTRSPDLLRAWFDEILPHVQLPGYSPRITVWPMWSWAAEGTDPDWLTDSRVLGLRLSLVSTDGAAAMREIELIRRDLERALEQIRGQD